MAKARAKAKEAFADAEPQEQLVAAKLVGVPQVDVEHPGELFRGGERHEVAAWLALWGVAVLAIGLLRGFTRALARQAMGALDQWSANIAQRRADERLWDMAQADPRLMADLQCALDRTEDRPARNLLELSQRRAARMVRDRMYYI